MADNSKPHLMSLLLTNTTDELLEHRMVRIEGEINERLALLVTQQLLYLQHDYPSRAMGLFVNSPGGAVAEGMAILDTMDLISSPIYTYCYGRADAMAAIIVAHGHSGNRYATFQSTFSLSDPWAKKPVDSQAEEIARTKSSLARIVANDTGQSVSAIELMMTQNKVFNAADAQDHNLIDYVTHECL